MKKACFILLIGMLAFSCNENGKTEAVVEESAVIEETEKEIAYQSIGEQITDEGVIAKQALIEQYKVLQPGDTVAVKFVSEVKEVCQNKGCWMKIDMGEEEAMIKFKDYGFFMPKDLAGKEVIVSGVAFVEEMSVEEQRHYAEDAGKTAAEVAAITEPKRTLSFISNGVLIPQQE